MKIKDLKFIDCHSHPHDERYEKEGVDMDGVLEELKTEGGGTIAIGTDYTETKNAIEFAKKYENCWATIGIHPADNHAETFDEKKFEELLEFGKEKIVGIGECGLDYFYFDKILKEKPDFDIDREKERQKQIFIKQVEFALKRDLPIVIHGRPSKNSMDAYRGILDILEKFAGVKGHAHFFVGNVDIAKRFLDLGFYISFDGPITFTNEYDSVINFVPMEKILIETDSPYASPAPHRGQINYPKYVKFVAKKIAELKKISEEEVLEITKNNTIKLFNLDKK